jgi:PilZ domain
MNNEIYAEDKGPVVPSGSMRQYPRMMVDIAIRAFPKNGVLTNGRGHDIGSGGMAMYVPLDLALGEKFDVSFQLPYSRIMLGLHAVVRNRNGFRYGIEFERLTKEEVAEINRVTAILELTGRTR